MSKYDVNSATLTNASQGIVTLLVNATGKWVYQFNSVQQQHLAQLVEGMKKQDAIALLTNRPGVGNATIQIQGNNDSSLPTDPSLISIVIQNGS